MLNFLNKAISAVFGSKSDRDIKELSPVVNQVKAVFEQLQSLSNDQLRSKTDDFRASIKTHLAEINAEIDQLQIDTEAIPETEIQTKVDNYKKIDELKKDRDKKLEEILLKILPEAFAVVKETARRFKENEFLEVTANDFDRNLATVKTNVVINGDKAVYANKWLAAGNEIVWDMVHYDVQLIGGYVLHTGKIAEMATGEGKTLVSTLPAYLNALSGLGVHLVTVNDYLAKRDSEWNAPLFEFHSISVDCIDKHRPNSPERKKAYMADIIYGTNNEFGFDYLRDNMSRTTDELVQRKHHFAMVDEVDSVLVDDARTPLIISGPVPKGDQHEFHQLKPRIENLVELQRKFVSNALAESKKLFADGKTDEAGIPLLKAHRGLPKNKPLIKFLSEPGVKTQLLKTEGFHMQDQNKEMHKIDKDLYFVIDEKNNSIELTDKGIETITNTGEDASFFILPDISTETAKIEKSGADAEDIIAQKQQLMLDFSLKAERIHTINQLLRAYTLYEKDTEYIVDSNKVKIVDEQTGRVLDGRRYSDGLHQAIEAKENVKVEASTQTFATVTLQNYFRMYHKLAGMTGTAETEAGEFWEIYKLDVVVIPTNRPISRKDDDDLVFKTKREKYNAVIDEIVTLVEAGRPVLVGTTSVEISELLSRMLNLRKIKHNVLNAKLHQKEADIVQEAGKAGTVTIATNMAGRGTDIKLGEGVKASGGLAIIGTERHDSRRVDRQLRGRAGRQGDPGSSKFFVSLEDNLMRLFGAERMSNLMDKMGHKEGEVIQHSMITKSIERAQRKVEENNFGIRKRLLEYDDVMNSQREVVYAKRRHALFGERLKIDINNMYSDAVQELIEKYRENGDYEGFKLEIIRLYGLETAITAEELAKGKVETLDGKLYTEIVESYQLKCKKLGELAMPVISQVYKERGSQIETIVVPFVSGNYQMQLPVNLKKAFESNGKEIITELEKAVVLNTIDENWKEHLRNMDDLKQSVQNAVYEQKDPLLIYKFESFKLFEQMLNGLNFEITGMLAKATIPIGDPEEVKEAKPLPKQVSNPKVVANRPQYVSSSSSNSETEYHQPETATERAPVRVGPKIGRNDPCPCGSGKKFKNCHGQE